MLNCCSKSNKLALFLLSSAKSISSSALLILRTHRLWPAPCFLGCDEQWPELQHCTGCPLQWNTMPSASITVKSGATGDQLSACVPLLWDSWSHQSAPPEPRCVRLPRSDHHRRDNNNIRLSHLVCRCSRGHLSTSINTNVVVNIYFAYFQAFLRKLSESKLTFSCFLLWINPIARINAGNGRLKTVLLYVKCSVLCSCSDTNIQWQMSHLAVAKKKKKKNR